MQYTTNYESPLGTIKLISDGYALTELLFDAEKFDKNDNLPVLSETTKWLDCYFSGKKPDFTPKLSLSCSAFRLEVLEILKKIPYGQITTYGQIANEIAKKHNIKKMSAQAVGGAVGYNPIPIIIPCHRVVGSNGSLTGYGGGIQRKIALLKLEKIDITDYTFPKKK